MHFGIRSLSIRFAACSSVCVCENERKTQHSSCSIYGQKKKEKPNVYLCVSGMKIVVLFVCLFAVSTSIVSCSQELPQQPKTRNIEIRSSTQKKRYVCAGNAEKLSEHTHIKQIL